ncbi:MAG: efflux RND transporter periplasmic adaptor subunit [Myxococcota bacterium]|nr:efflux RND transporter periplasmic adaptor subunit [Myxococcota bacterium]
MTLFLLLACALGGDDHGDHDGHGEHADEHGDDHGDERVFELSDEAVAAARLVIAEASVSTLAGELSLPGRIALDPRREAQVSAWIPGQVDAILVRPGDSVTRGQRLGTVQSPELGEAIAAFRAAKAADDAADARLERLRRLEEDGVASISQVLDAEAEHAEAIGALEAAEERLSILGVDPTIGDPHAGEHFPSRIPVRSPLAGKVLFTDVRVGQRVEPGQALFHIGDLDQVWLLLDVYERQLAAVAEGQSVRFTVDAWPDRAFEGTVDQVGDWVEPDARTVEVRVVVDNADHALKPNMFAQAVVELSGQGDEGVVLPVEAVVTLDGEAVVFVEEEPGRYEAREVHVARNTATHALVVDGIEAGERVVTEGAFTLKSELEKGELGEGHAH